MGENVMCALCERYADAFACESDVVADMVKQVSGLFPDDYAKQQYDRERDQVALMPEWDDLPHAVRTFIAGNINRTH
jgi:hypothetical protein